MIFNMHRRCKIWVEKYINYEKKLVENIVCCSIIVGIDCGLGRADASGRDERDAFEREGR